MDCPFCHSKIPDGAVFCPRCGSAQPDRNEPNDFAYAAFISYRHLPRDTEAAQQVQKAIETYRLPHGVAAGQQDDEDDGTTQPGRLRPGKTLGKCFRDEDELAASPSLPDSIQRALAQSRTLVIICSPDTQESRWVQREIETFAALHGRERIICVLAAGDSTTSIPPLLKTRMMPDAHGIMREMPAEPLAADLRPASKAKRKAERLRIIAAVAGCNFDDLRQRERARKQKRFAAAILSSIILLCLICILALQFRITNNNAKEAESRALAAQAQEQLARGERIQAIETALAALPSSEADSSRPLVPVAQEALEDALTVYPDPCNLWRPLCTIDTTTPILQFAINNTGTRVAAIEQNGMLDIFAGKNGCLLRSIDLHSLTPDPLSFNVEAWAIMEADSDAFLLFNYTDNGCVALIDAHTGIIRWKVQGMRTNSIAVDETRNIFAIFTITDDEAIQIGLVEIETGESITWGQVEKTYYSHHDFFLPSCFSSETGSAAINVGPYVLDVDLNTGNYVFKSLSQKPIWSLLSAQGTLVAATGDFVTKETGGLAIPYDFCARSMPSEVGEEPLWHAEGTYNLTNSGPSDDLVAYHGEPRVQCFLPTTKLAVACTAGQSLRIFSCSDGAEVYREEYPSSIVRIGSLYHEDLETRDYSPICVITSDGLLELKMTGGPVADIEEWKRQLPNRIDQAEFAMAAENGCIAYAHAADRTTRILAYQYDNDSEDDEKAFSLDELIERAHSILEDC